MLNKSGISLIIVLGLFVVVILKLDSITEFTTDLIDTTPKVQVDNPNNYAYNENYSFIQKSEDFIPYNIQDIYNIFYSVLDNGYDTFSFYCPSEYTECINDVEKVSGNQIVLTNIGNFVHPFNNFTNLEVVTNSLGEVNITVTKTYSKEKVDAINKKVDEIIKEVITDDMSIDDKILALHDYIIDYTEYDENLKEESSNSYGLLYNKVAKCSGYADTMAIFLDRLNVKNFKVASDEHVWNAVYLNDNWWHLDLTWDDPIVTSTNGVMPNDNIRHKFFMIDGETLKSYDTEDHNFDKSVYVEID